MYSPNVVTESGDTFIPASQRPDGTWRKARRVKEGYVPQEEVPLYESKGKQFMSRNVKPEEPVRLASGQTAHRPIPGLFIIEDKERKPPRKRHQKKVDEVAKRIEAVSIGEKGKEQPLADPVKKLKNLRKRLREVEALEEKLRSGGLQKPEPEQLAKIQRKNDLLMQIRELEKQLG